LAECEILNFVFDRLMRTAWMTTCLLPVERLNTAGHVIFSFNFPLVECLFTPKHFLKILWKSDLEHFPRR